ncbi:helix-turn-helix domain-containing protein [Curvibacter sp. HBC28]|uniref:Helix-turn-helix domain-containing protein n=1 Tax=Curvibacter microcysteis TaxID=3026419 RepID=A0ABT5M9X4_9BURK|nr:GAF domain-containing protein [Curvibacter sp. HBC28]MDD0813190.1 helix-turn-helix domain-containing protein [Curvibacter sp. HBC28]
MPLTSPNFLSHADRVLAARRRYFEEGVLPTGVVSDVVFQSWNRCHRAHHEPQSSIEFQPVSVSRSQLALQKNRELHEAWLNELPGIGSALGSTNCSAILTDASGVLIGVTPNIWPHLNVMPVAHRLGVNLSEELVGTTAPGLVVRTGKAASVHGAEHFYDCVSTMHCTAAPIHNLQGQLAGILDISCEGHRFHFDPVTVVGLYAASIENRLLVAQAKEHFIVRFQFVPAMVDTPMAGLLGFDESGGLVWLNSMASTLLRMPIDPAERGPCTVEDILELKPSQMRALANGTLSELCLIQGPHVHLRCHAKAAAVPPISTVALASLSPAPQPVGSLEEAVLADGYLPPNSLKEADADLIRKCLAECQGNVSSVARKLKVSRGLIYRRLTALSIEPSHFKPK